MAWKFFYFEKVVKVFPSYTNWIIDYGSSLWQLVSVVWLLWKENKLGLIEKDALSTNFSSSKMRIILDQQNYLSCSFSPIFILKPDFKESFYKYILLTMAKSVILHNINKQKRDATSFYLNRVQYKTLP